MGRTATLARIDVHTLAELRALPNPELTLHDAFGFDDYEGPSDPWLRLELDKSWHGLHYLLTGEKYGFDTPLGAAIFGGERNEYEAHFLSSVEVARISHLLGALKDVDIKQRLETWRPSGHEVYGVGDWSDPSVRAHYLRLFHELRQFYADASRRGASIVQWNQ